MTRDAGVTIITELGVAIPMRDGTVLRADVTRPHVDAPVSVLLVRSPYLLEGARVEVDPIQAAQRGLALVIQSMRGTGTSEGEFEPWLNEQKHEARALCHAAGRDNDDLARAERAAASARSAS